MSVKKLLAKYCETDPENQITLNKLELDAFTHQLAVSEVVALIWGYKHLAYIAENDIRKSVAATIVKLHLS